jgi:translation elongation factor EF-G
LKLTRSGDTIVQREQPVPRLLDGVIVPEPVFLTSLELEHSKNEKLLYDALNALCIEDPSFNFDKDSGTG